MRCQLSDRLVRINLKILIIERLIASLFLFYFMRNYAHYIILWINASPGLSAWAIHHAAGEVISSVWSPDCISRRRYGSIFRPHGITAFCCHRVTIIDYIVCFYLCTAISPPVYSFAIIDHSYKLTSQVQH